MSDALSVDAAVSRKTRSPSLLERFLYTPLAASAGQADNRQYKGDLDLAPEVAHGLGAGFTARVAGMTTRAQLFWQDITDFIQGQRAQVSDSFLTYTNVNARLYGAETSVEGTLARVGLDALAVAAWASATRGKNTDNDDPLYRIAPLRGGVSADWVQDRWSVGVELLVSERKDRVARYNAEQVTPGYGIVNLRGELELAKNQKLTAGVENVFDKFYFDPLTGVNRVLDSVVPVGFILPASGRSATVRVDWSF